jgi:hypothetical protein
MMLGIHDIELILERKDTSFLLQGAFRLQWIAQCVAFIEDAEKDRVQLVRDGFTVDAIVLDQIEDCTRAMLDMITLGHRPEFALLYGREIFIEDHERSMYNATQSLRRFGAEKGDKDIVYKDAYSAALKQGKSEQYAHHYAMAMSNEPWEEKAQEYAQAFEDAWNEARAEKHGEAYCQKYAEMVSYMEYNRSYCKLYAKTYERAVEFYSNESEREKFAEYFSNEYYEYSCRQDSPESEEHYFFDRAFAFIEGSRFGGELKIENFAEKFVDCYLNAFPDYPSGREDSALRVKALEIAKEKAIEYFNRTA